ncbi:PH domain-containing protein [Streptomyces sp. GMY01]|uniref:PH domain-containing protein n=1 Tax=Streptomyces sp. GMY02 TaxID=1333528 RepID=UPI00146F736E|nr:PH domain-containing protein [Streptomyces sp. GMY02]NMO32439.1 PH domain-containing protein [Streptomyces sp. GMY02]
MTTPAHEPPAPEYKDRVNRSTGGVAGGVVLLALVLWLGFDAMFTGDGRTPWLALAGMILVVPFIVAFTLRPAVYVNSDRLRVRNPFRLIVLPWGQIAVLRSGYSNEVLTKSGDKYQMWAVPVSLRARKRAARQEARAATAGERGAAGAGRGAVGLGGRGGVLGRAGSTRGLSGGGSAGEPIRAEGDQFMADLRELHEAREDAESAQGAVTVRWAYEILGPAVAGALVLVILLVIG